MVAPATEHPFDDGFLSDAVRAVRHEVHRKYARHVQLAYLVNRRAVALQHEIRIHPDKLEELIGAALYARTLAFSQSASLLLEHGLPVQARTVLRAGLETLFSLAAVAKDRSIASSLLASHDADRRTLADRIQRWKNPALRASIAAELPEADLAAMASAVAKATNVYELAKAGDMEDWYLTLYTLLSFSAHSKVSDLDRHVVVNDEGEPIEFQNEPDISNQETVWAWGIDIQLASMRSTAALFSVEVEELEALRKRLEKLDGEPDRDAPNHSMQSTGQQRPAGD